MGVPPAAASRVARSCPREARHALARLGVSRPLISWSTVFRDPSHSSRGPGCLPALSCYPDRPRGMGPRHTVPFSSHPRPMTSLQGSRVRFIHTHTVHLRTGESPPTTEGNSLLTTLSHTDFPYLVKFRGLYPKVTRTSAHAEGGYITLVSDSGGPRATFRRGRTFGGVQEPPGA
jgi:hypothetical protein